MEKIDLGEQEHILTYRVKLSEDKEFISASSACLTVANLSV